MAAGFDLEALNFVEQELLEIHQLGRLEQGIFTLIFNFVETHIKTCEVGEQWQKFGHVFRAFVRDIVIRQGQAGEAEQVVRYGQILYPFIADAITEKPLCASLHSVPSTFPPSS